MILEIYNGYGIEQYGFCIALGALLATYLATKDPRKVFTKDQIYNLFSYCIIVGTLGGWLLSLATTGEHGFSVLGSIIALVLFLTIYFHALKIPILAGLDFCAPYAPLVQAFGRIGCFFAGCCAGAPTTVPWAVNGVHPSQLYSAGLLFGIFFFLRWLSGSKTKPGTVIATYLLLAGLERFVTDFFRADHGVHGYIALGVSTTGLLWLLWTYERKSIHPR